jgi:PAS domain S-box-containing protein
MKKTRVFVVEDESIVARDIQVCLEGMGYEVAGTAASGKDALKGVAEARPGVVLMDIMLQGSMDGIETAELIRSSYNIPVIFLTAYDDDTILGRAKLTGPFGYIIKPFEDKDLRLAIEVAGYKHQMEEELRLSREQYRSILETAGAIPWEMDTGAGRFRYIGPQTDSILGYGPGELSDFMEFLSHVPEDNKEEVRRFYLTPGKERAGTQIEYPFISQAGEEIWLKDTGSIYVPDDNILRGFMLDITWRKFAEEEMERYINDLQEALEKIRTLQGMLPICAWCKKIRDDKGYWQQVEVYIEDHSKAAFTHSMCPECKSRMEGELGEYKKGGSDKDS